MKLATYEAVVENGQIKLLENIELPEKAKVYVIIPEEKVLETVYIRSPRLVDKSKLADFHKEMIEE
ncbi:MAG: antitoxin AF2212-like protein [Blastocatellia bacterium]